MATSEYCSCPPRVPTPTASHVAIASGVNHRVTSPRWTSARSYAGQFPTRYFVLYLGCTLDFTSRSCPFGRHDGQGRDEHLFPRTNATRNRYAVPAMVHASTMSAKPAINSEKPKICGTSASSSPWLNGDRHDRSDVLNSRHGHESSQGPRADTGVVGCHECVAPDWWVLPSSSVGEESLSPNHPDTSSRF